MYPRFPGFGFAICAPLAVLLAACGGSVKMGASAPAPAMPPQDGPAAPQAESSDHAAMARDASTPPAAPAPAALGSVAEGAPEPEPATGAPQGAAPVTPPGAGAIVAPSREMLDIEANVEIQVANVRRAVKSLHQLAARSGGVITAERSSGGNGSRTASLTLRVPSTAAQGVLQELDALGTVLSQNVTARDIGKEYFDAGLRLSSLEATLHRYEEILARATKVEEMLRIEQELSRLRAEIEQVKGNLRWLRDRAARATLNLTLREDAPVVVEPHEPEPEPKFFPGLRAPLLLDFGKQDNQRYGGGGLSLRFSRGLSLDLDLLKRFGSSERGPDAITATVGGEMYSELMGAGKRALLNPYLGWRAGYARFDNDDQALVGVTLGVELFKNRWFAVDLEARNHLMFLGPRGGHYALEPALSAGFAF